MAQSIGMNTVRFLVCDPVCQQESAGYRKRIDPFLAVAERHGKKSIFAIFDSSWDPVSQLGPQHRHIPGANNSGWAQSLGERTLTDATTFPHPPVYEKSLVGVFANDPRILTGDTLNEPDNLNIAAQGNIERRNRTPSVKQLFPRIFVWAREARIAQPLISGVWTGDWSSLQSISLVAGIQIGQSDIITSHNHGWRGELSQRMCELPKFHRPIICAEYMAKSANSFVDTILRIARRYHVGPINRELVAGKTQTCLPRCSWQLPHVTSLSAIWFSGSFLS